MKRYAFPVIFAMVAFGCHSNQTPSAGDFPKTSDTVKKNYLPVLDYLKSEIGQVDSFPALIKQYRTVNGIAMDSGIITTSAFDRLARVFLLSDLDSALFEKKFEENSFVDRTTNLISFTYSTKDSGNGLKRVDVLLSPGAINSKLNSIYMESIYVNGDSSSIIKMSWKAGASFNILKILKLKGEKESTEQTVVEWNNRD